MDSLQKEGQELCSLVAQRRERLKAQGTGHKAKIVKNPDPKDLALDSPLRRLPYSFPLAAVCWSDGVVE